MSASTPPPPLMSAPETVPPGNHLATAQARSVQPSRVSITPADRPDGAVDAPTGDMTPLQDRAPDLASDGARLELDLDELFKLHAAYVAGVAIRLLGRDDDVEDVVQDVFLAAHRGMHRVRNDYALRAWLVKITVRMARRRLHLRRAKRMLYLDEQPDYANLAATDATQDAVIELRWTYKQLDRMPADERLCWTLRHVESKTLDEVAEVTGLSLSTVKRRIGDAKRRLTRARGH